MMPRKLFQPTLLVRIGTILILLTAPLLILARGNASQPASTFQWDSKASGEVSQALHYMHEVWNRGDMSAVKDVIAGDDVLVTFELDADNKTPIALHSRKEIVAFMDRVTQTTAEVSENYVMEMPKMSCRTTATFGVCTEECTVHLVKNGRTERVDKLFGTAVAVKYPDGWKWIQWHMSVGPSVNSTQISAR